MPDIAAHLDAPPVCSGGPLMQPRALRPRRTQPRTLSVVVSVVLLVMAPFSWWWSIDDPVLRSTGFSAWILIAAALALSLSAAWRDRRRWVIGVALLELVALAVFVWAFFVFARLPASQLRSSAPDFTLSDQDHREVTLARELAEGPVLLVFYRGHW